MSNVNVVELGDFLKTDRQVREFMALLRAGPGLVDALEVVLPQLPQYEQRILATIVAFRLLGAMMPASPELFAHLPLTASINESHLMAAAQSLVDGGVLQVETQNDEMCFYWDSLERLVLAAVADAHKPKTPAIVGVDGERLR